MRMVKELTLTLTLNVVSRNFWPNRHAPDHQDELSLPTTPAWNARSTTSAAWPTLWLQRGLFIALKNARRCARAQGIEVDSNAEKTLWGEEERGIC